MIQEQPWRAFARCNGESSNLFFAPDDASTAIAKSICATCRVVDECGAAAVANDEHGVWGGTTRTTRRSVSRRARFLATAAERREEIGTLLAKGVAPKEVARRLHCHENTVYTVLRQMKDTA